MIEDVKKIQRFLGLVADGNIGPLSIRAIANKLNTQNTTKHIQSAVGVRADGVIGPMTIREIINKFGLDADAPIVANPSKFTENVILSKQTTGQYAQKITPKAVVLHHTSGNYLGSIDWTNRVYDNNSKRLYGSYHVIIARDGRRTITNEDTNRAYHSGASSFKGRTNLNSWSLGLAWERDTNTEPLQDSAIESALEWLLPRMKKWNLTPDDVTDHRTVATPQGRKNDLKKSEFDKFHQILKERWKSYT